jgi:hypothetical protein
VGRTSVRHLQPDPRSCWHAADVRLGVVSGRRETGASKRTPAAHDKHHSSQYTYPRTACLRTNLAALLIRSRTLRLLKLIEWIRPR